MEIQDMKEKAYKIFVDIETIPGPTPPDLEDIQAPANYKDPAKIKAYKESKIQEAHRTQAFDSMRGEIVAIGFAVEGPGGKLHREPQVLIRDPALFEDEADLMEVFEEQIESYKPATWIGHNVKTFDLQWLWRKAVKYDLVRLAKMIPRERYSKQAIDTLELWAGPDYRDKTKLDDIASFLGINGKTPGMDGSQVYDLYQEKRYQEIADYCRQDVWLTKQVYEVISAMR